VLAANPDHPGAYHYVIHAYDYPPLADKAEKAARGYADVAPAVPHALHMPSHIFTRLGLWEESIDWNTRSAAAAKAHPAEGAVSLHYLHALDYLAYARLQRAEDSAADEVAATTAALEGPFQTHGASAYTLAAVPARVALERENWEAAAALEAGSTEFAWDRFPQMEAITWFARGIGAARAGDAAAARRALERLEELHAAVPPTAAYWATQVEIQRLAVQAWTELAEGAAEAALATMQASAALEAATEKHPITPGEVLPARELLGDMLRETGRYEEAIEAYEQALERSPNRFRSLFGAGKAAELAGDPDSAAEWYRQLLELVIGDGEGRPAVEHAKQVVAAM
jgi:tetratricopeptide (TPR) repeat protein